MAGRAGGDDLLEILAILAPGQDLRSGIERIIKSGKGAIIVLGNDDLVESIVSGGFRLETDFSAERLSEVAKMDGAIIVDDEVKTLVWANVHLVPDPSIPTSETGTRHRSAERTAIQSGKPVISVSESTQIVTLYFHSIKRVLEDSASILFRANQALSTLERYRNRLDEVSSTLSALEVENVVTLRDVLVVLQRAEMVKRIAVEIDHAIAELGTDGRLLQLQLDELMLGVGQERTLVVRDYLTDRRRRPEKVMATLAEPPRGGPAGPAAPRAVPRAHQRGGWAGPPGEPPRPPPAVAHPAAARPRDRRAGGALRVAAAPHGGDAGGAGRGGGHRRGARPLHPRGPAALRRIVHPRPLRIALTVLSARP